MTIEVSSPVAATMTGEDSVGRRRNPAFEYLRIAACLAVITVHVAAPFGMTAFNGPAWWIGTSIGAGLRWCVPAFVMLSGYFNLSDPRNAEPKTYLKKRLGRLIPAVVVWSVFYLIYSHYRLGWPSDLADATRRLWAGVPFYHMYFLFLIMGLYVFTPPLVLGWSALDRTSRWYVTSAALAFGAVATLGELNLNAVTWFLPYIGYYLLGAALRDAPILPRRTLIGVIVLCWVLTLAGSWIISATVGTSNRWTGYFFDYLSPQTIAISAAIFLLFRDLNLRGAPRLLWLSSLTLGVYLVHALWLDQLSYLVPSKWPSLIQIPLKMTVTTVLSFGVIAVLSRISLLKRVVG